MIEDSFRSPTHDEYAILARLLEADFPGRDDLIPMISNLEVKTIDEMGGLALQPKVHGYAHVVKRVPVEAEAKDVDGVVVHVLLHVLEGQPTELEIFREDGDVPKRIPDPASFDLIVLPPVPSDSAWCKPPHS